MTGLPPETTRELAELRALIPPDGPRRTVWFVGAPLEVTELQYDWLVRLVGDRHVTLETSD